MNRLEFTDRITRLIQQMVAEGENPILDFALRSLPEQQRLFKEGSSKCDGVTILSGHQLGKAVDIYFQGDGKLTQPKKGAAYWHDQWANMGGKRIITWDLGHYEG